jgi:hypothetical protein
MAKFQFQSTEDLLIRLPPFIKSTDGTYIYTGDTCAVVVVKPGGTLYGSAVTMTRDANTGHWTGSIPLADHEHGVWLVKATSSGVAGALEQFREYAWGDYVDDITLTKTQATNAASSASSADGKCTTIQSKTDNLPSDPADQSLLAADIAAVKGDTAAVKLVTDGLPTFPSDPADESALEAVIAAVQGDVTAIKAKTDVPVEIASAAAVGAVQSDLTTVKTDTTFIKRMQGGRWKILGTQLVCYYLDGVVWTEFTRFNLKDDTGAPTQTRIFEREPV